VSSYLKDFSKIKSFDKSTDKISEKSFDKLKIGITPRDLNED
jgi:hypothetical protein